MDPPHPQAVFCAARRPGKILPRPGKGIAFLHKKCYTLAVNHGDFDNIFTNSPALCGADTARRMEAYLMNTTVIRSRLNTNLEVSVISGHFATRHSHNSHYIDITRMKHEHTMAAEAALTLSRRYAYDKGVDTILCLDGSEVIGAFLAGELSKSDMFSVNSAKRIYVITPEYDSNGQLIFRDNLTPMVQGKDVLILISTVNSGKSIRRVLECVAYYGGRVQGVAAVFSTMDTIDQVPIYSLFTPADIPGYLTHAPEDCPMCRAGHRIDALANSYGISRL